MTAIEATEISPIAQLNDRFRQGDYFLGKVCLSPAVQAFSSEEQQEIFRLVRVFDEFTEENDPWQEHDFGAIEFQDEVYNWKIDYYSLDLKHGSKNPSDPKVTTRVLTLMHSSEY